MKIDNIYKDISSEVIMSEDEIAKYNLFSLSYGEKFKLYKSADHLRKISRRRIIEIAETCLLPSNKCYINGKKITGEYIDNLIKKREFENIPINPDGRFLKTCVKADIRKFPTEDFCSDFPDDEVFDLFEETEIEADKELLSLYTTRNGEWQFIISDNSFGWIKSEQIHEATNGYSNKKSPTEIPYSRQNIIKSAIRFLNLPYKWGGVRDGFDCSGFVGSVFNDFGILLPRNSEDIISMRGISYNLENLNDKEKYDAIQMLGSGSLLYFPGHIMIYIGNIYGKHYVISAVYSYCTSRNSKLTVKTPRRVCITDLEIYRKNKKTWIESLTEGLFITDRISK